MESFFATLKKEKLYKNGAIPDGVCEDCDLPVCDDLLQQATDIYVQSERMAPDGIPGTTSTSGRIAKFGVFADCTFLDKSISYNTQHYL